MVEYIARVDERDTVIGKTTKPESHAQGYSHRVVAVFVFFGKKLLVNEREDNGLFDHSVGGHVRYGESYDVAARREAYEEVGLDESVTLKYIARFFVTEKKGEKVLNHWFSLYEAFVSDKFYPRAQAGEVRSLFFSALSDVYRDMVKNPHLYTQGFLETMRKYREWKNPQE